MNESSRPSEVHEGVNSADDENRPISYQEETWQTHPISMFRDKYRGINPEDRSLPSKVRKFYRSQDRLINDLQSTMSILHNNESELLEKNKALKRKLLINGILLKVTLILNIALVISKLTASILSGSLSIISSLMDSLVDLVSSFTLMFTAHQMQKVQPYSYPTGRKKLEPIAVIILSVIMASISVQIIVQAVQTIVEMATKNQGPPHMTDLSIALVALTIVIKGGLFCACWKCGSGESIAALKNDQFNDTISNSVALVFSTLSSRIEGVPYLKYLDPCGAILIGIYIISSWWKMAAEHIRKLSGYRADAAFLQRITFICLNHHPSIEWLDTVRAFYCGSNYMVEVDIVLPQNMDLHMAHDIGESLQQKLESLDEVERAFVHLDYEFAHNPQSEHKIT